MKAKIIPIITLFYLFSILFFSCEDTTYKEYLGYAPVYLSYKELRSGAVGVQSVDLKNPGKIYFKDNYIFIIEELKGIHVFDNADPSSPVNKAFVKLPGVVDISISGNYMYADSYVDLVVIDVQNIDNIREAGRVQDVLPYTVPPTEGKNYPVGYVDKENGVVTSWELKTIRERISYTPNPYPIYGMSSSAFMEKANASGASSGVSGSGVGMGGSMARFGIKGDVLYMVNSNTLKIFDISNKTSPFEMNEFNAGANIETMFLTDKTMFLGTTTGMIIYDLTYPTAPVMKTFFTHARSCDPVIVDDTLAYITLRTGTSCGGNVSMLDIVNIKDITQPVTVISYWMTNPYGLGKDGRLLFICDGNDGLKVYDATDPKQLLGHILYTYPKIKAYDVIPLGGILMLISDDGLYQYNYSNVQNINLISKISVVKN